MNSTPAIGGIQRIPAAENRRVTIFDKVCNYCSNPEYPAIVRSCTKNGRKPYLYPWNQIKKNYAGSDGMPYASGVLDDIGNHHMKHPEHPKATVYRCGVISTLMLLFFLGVIGIGGSDSGGQDVFVIFFIFIVAIYIFCVVWRVQFILRSYRCQRHEEFLEIFRRREASAPHVKFRLINFGWTLVAEVQEHGHVTNPDEVRFNQQPNSANRFALKDTSVHQDRFAPGFLEPESDKQNDEINIRDSISPDHKKFTLKEQGTKPIKSSKQQDLDLTDEEKNNPYGGFEDKDE